MARDDPFVATLKRELEHYPGVEMNVEAKAGKHRRAIFKRDGDERFMVLPVSSSDNIRGPKNAVRDMRKTLGELGAERIDVPARSKRQANAEHRTFDVRMGSSKRAVIISVPKANPLHKRFSSKEHSWKLELRGPAGGTGDPLVALVPGKLPAGKARKPGLIHGSKGMMDSWVLNFQDIDTRKLVTDRLGEWRAAPIKLKGDVNGELIFAPPAERKKPILRGKAREQAELEELERLTTPAEPPPEVIQKMAEEAIERTGIVVRPEVHVEFDPAKPMVLQLPKQTVSLEQAVNVINRLKEAKGQDLRLTISEGGFLAVVQKLGIR